MTAGNDIYKLTEYDRRQITDITDFKYPNQVGYILRLWKNACSHKTGSGEKNNFIKLSISNTPTALTGSTNCLIWAMHVCVKRQTLFIMDQKFIAALKEQKLYKLLILLSFTKDKQIPVKISGQWAGCRFNYFY